MIRHWRNEGSATIPVKPLELLTLYFAHRSFACFHNFLSVRFISIMPRVCRLFRVLIFITVFVNCFVLFKTRTFCPLTDLLDVFV